jgi:SAM-dependent methyltransferase
MMFNMPLRYGAFVLVGVLAVLAGVPGGIGVATRAQQQQQTPPAPVRTPDIFWLPTKDPVVDAMLKLANVTKTDVVYDLGCGDGKIVIAAARTYGARGVGIDIDPARIVDSNANAKKAGVTDRVKFVLGDIFDPAVKIEDATVVTLYLLPWINEKLKPRLKAELRPGTRVVSNSFSMGTDWPPEQTVEVDGTPVFLWTIPRRPPAP